MRRPLVILLLTLVTACQAVTERIFTPPVVALRGVRVTSIGIGGGSVDVGLQVANPNPYRLSATKATYRLLVRDSIEVGHGESVAPFTVAAHDSASVQLPLAVSWRGLRTAAGEALGDGTVEYRIVGELVATTPVGGHSFSLSSRGRFAAMK